MNKELLKEGGGEKGGREGRKRGGRAESTPMSAEAGGAILAFELMAIPSTNNPRG